MNCLNSIKSGVIKGHEEQTHSYHLGDSEDFKSSVTETQNKDQTNSLLYNRDGNPEFHLKSIHFVTSVIHGNGDVKKVFGSTNSQEISGVEMKM